jgi:hypothetical protein
MVTVKRDGKRWAIYVNGELIEGGFFGRSSALNAADAYRQPGCPDCGARGERRGHMTCAYPQEVK